MASPQPAAAGTEALSSPKAGQVLRGCCILLLGAALLAANPAGAGQPPAAATDLYCRALHLPVVAAPAPSPRPLLGIAYEPAEVAASPCPRAQVQEVFPGSAAEAADLRPGDLVLSLDGQTVCAEAGTAGVALRDAVAGRRSGEAIVIELLRAGERRQQTVRLGSRPTWRAVAAAHPPAACPDRPSLLAERLAGKEQTQAFAGVVAGLAEQADVLHRLSPPQPGGNPLQRNEFTFLMRQPLQAGRTARELTEPFAAGAAADDWRLADLLRPLAALADIPPLPAASPPATVDLPALVAALEAATTAVRHLLTSFSADERRLLRSAALGAGDEPDWNRFLAVATRVEPQAILQALSPLLPFLDADALARLRADLRQRFPDPAAPLLYRAESGAGPILVGGTTATTYDEDAALILDLGGDDLYRNNAGGSRPAIPVALVIDWGGDDRYLTGAEVAQGAGLLGAGLLLDLGGSDRFEAGDISQGSGVLGIGLLLHRGDGARYRGRLLAQGAARNGLGLLCEGSGPTVYEAGEKGQGFGALGGVGVLVDAGGDDAYRIGGLRPDFRDPQHATVSMGQGFGYGIRPGSGVEGASGGIGILLDVAGNDDYQADYFGQGGAYYFSLGILRDRQGNDRYRAGRYVQGAGVHAAVGVLVDEAGDDSYDASFGVAQGLGHDYAAGLLEDVAGNDVYRGGSLVQGAATTGGLGLLLDGAGRDAFHARQKNPEQGIGMLLQLEQP